MNTQHHDPLTPAHRLSAMRAPDPSPSEPSGARQASQPSRLPLKTAALMVVAVGGFYLLREHWEHVAGHWSYLLLLACALMHLFHGHGGHGRHDTADGKFNGKFNGKSE